MSDSDVFTAERIVNKRFVNGVPQYCIKWKGYSSRENTWEPADNILDRGLLTAFEKKQAKEAKKTKRTPAKSSSQSNVSARDFDNRENSIGNPAPATPTENLVSATTDTESPKLEIISTQATTPENSVSVTSPDHSSPKLKNISTQATTSESLPLVTSQSESPKSKNNSTQATISENIVSVPDDDSPELKNISTQASITPFNVMANNFSNIVPRCKVTTTQTAILNTFVTDVTVDDHTITIRESKTNQGFFREPPDIGNAAL